MRQMSLVVGHYRHRHFFNPPTAANKSFVTGEVTLGSPVYGAKAIFQNWGFRDPISSSGPFLQRRLHFWFQVRPPDIDIDDPWADEPPFDPYTFTLPTQRGPVAPARFRRFRQLGEREFSGVPGDFLEPVYFQQEVLCKYEGASGFDVGDNGSVRCGHYWGLDRSVARIGNALLRTNLGDFAEGVHIEEWPHWRQYAVEPPVAHCAIRSCKSSRCLRL